MNKKMPQLPVKLTRFEKIQLYLFEDPKNIPEYHKLSEEELRIKSRYAKVFTFWIDNPTLSDKKIINYMMSELGIAKSQAYRDISNIKLLLGNVRNATKEWHRYKLIAMIDKAYEYAERNFDAKGMIMAASALGKFTQLDKEDVQMLPYDEIVPQNWEITGDVTVMGLQPIENLEAKQKKMREKYGGALIEEAEEIDEKE